MIAAVLAALAAGAAPALAQNPFESPNPFSSEPPAAKEEAKPKAGGEAAPAKEEASAEEEAPAEAETDPAVLAIEESHPTTPQQRIRAARDLLDIGRPAEAKKQLAPLAAAKLQRQVLAALQQRFGSALFLRLIRDERLAPEGRQLGQAVLEAARRAATDRRRLDGLVAKLFDAKREVRLGAMFDLQSAGAAAVAPLTAVLADPNRESDHAAAREALVRLGEVAAPPLCGALSAPDESLRAQVIDVLGRIGDRGALIDLAGAFVRRDSSETIRRAASAALERMFGRTPTEEEAEQYLAARAESLLEDASRESLRDRRVDVWRWDEQRKESVSRSEPAAAALLAEAARAARDLTALAPENADYRTLHWLIELRRAKREAGLDQPLPAGPGTVRAEAGAAGAAAMEAVLAESLRRGQDEAAAGAAEVLGDLGDASLLASRDGRLSPLAAALRCPDRRVRFAAAEAILRIDPRRPFAGSSYLVEELGYFARSRGAVRVLIGHPQPERADALAAMLREIGYEADTAQTGGELSERAAANPDYEWVLASASLDRPRLDSLLQMLRRDPHTARLPVCVTARPSRVAEARRLADRDPLTVWTAPPRDAATMAREAARSRSAAGAERPAGPERLRQAAAALDQLARLAESPEAYGFYDLLRQEDAVLAALETPELSSRAARVLGRLGTVAAQEALVDLASRTACPLEDRQAAAAAFALAVQHRGLGLGRSQILLQYERYNQSAALDRPTQELLGSILDSIEARTR